MKNRDIRVYLDDMLESIAKIEEYCQDLCTEEFFEKSQVQDAVVRRLEIIGEAAKHIPAGVLRFPDLIFPPAYRPGHQVQPKNS